MVSAPAPRSSWIASRTSATRTPPSGSRMVMVRPGPWAATVPLRMPIASARLRASSSAVADWLSELVSWSSAVRWSADLLAQPLLAGVEVVEDADEVLLAGTGQRLVVADVADLDGEGETEQQGEDADQGGGQRVPAPARPDGHRRPVGVRLGRRPPRRLSARRFASGSAVGLGLGLVGVLRRRRLRPSGSGLVGSVRAGPWLSLGVDVRGLPARRWLPQPSGTERVRHRVVGRLRGTGARRVGRSCPEHVPADGRGVAEDADARARRRPRWTAARRRRAGRRGRR